MSGWKLTRPATPPKTTGGRRGSRIGCSWRSSSLALSITRRNHESSVSRRQPKRQCGLPYRRLSCSARLTVMLISDLHIADSHYLWTLFGPYARDRKGPQQTGPKHEIKGLGVSGTPRESRNQLEVGVRASLNEFDVCGRGGIGRRACLRCMWATPVEVQVLSTAPLRQS